MTHEEFLETIDGFEEYPFKITMNGTCSSPLRFIKALSDSVKVLSNGKPAVYKYSSIESMTFDIEDNCEPDSETAANLTSATLEPAKAIKKSNLDEAKNVIRLCDFSYLDNNAKIKDAIHNTPLEKEWVKIHNMINDAKKNHVLPEKIKGIIRHMENLPRDLDCIEYYILLGEVHALDDDFPNASYRFELAEDYRNAAYYAAQCGEKSNTYLLEIFQKWILSGKEYDKDVISSFMALCYSMRCGKLCVDIVKAINYYKASEEIKRVIYLGLILVLSNYHSDDSELFALSESDDNVSTLLDALMKDSASESYKSVIIDSLKHANELSFDRKEKSSNVWDDNIQTGYIIKAWPSYGFIGENQDDYNGIRFNLNNINSNDLAGYISECPRSVIGLKVVYRIDNNNVGIIANKIEPAENLDSYVRSQGIDKKAQVKTAEEKLIPLSDGKSYIGYINSLKIGFGFIYKDFDSTQSGVYFHFNELEEKLRSVSGKIKGLKVKCQLADSKKEGHDKEAVNIQAAESIETFLANQSEDFNSHVEDTEIVDEEVIHRMLQTHSPSAAVQEFATTNKPFYALKVLEIASDSFPYDKYVRHKIQLLQRTRSNDNELINLLNYTISTSSDGAYIAHNLYFLGQVQFRCKQYSDVVTTMNRLFRFRKFMKTSTQYTDSVFLIAVAYYMLRDYDNADLKAKELLNLSVHVEKANKILDRTFGTEESINNQVDDNDVEFALQFDSDVAITPYIEKLINSFSFGSISVKDVPSDFDPWSSDCSVEMANDYIQRLIKYDGKTAQRNNPNAAIAIAKIQKWMITQVSGAEKEESERSLRDNVSRALQIMSRNTILQSGLDIRVNLFYRMQQYKMSIREKKTNLFNAYINAHFASSPSISLNTLKPARNSELKGTNHLLMISDLLFLLSYMDKNELDYELEQVKKICSILTSRTDSNKYIAALRELFRLLGKTYNEKENVYPQILSGVDGFKKWLDENKKEIRSQTELGHWNELVVMLEHFDNTLLSEYECAYFDKVREIARLLMDAENNTQTAMKQNVLNQSKNQLNELEEKLQEEPTYVLYSIFADVLSIMNKFVLSMLAEVMSHGPSIDPVGSLQLNLGLTTRKEFILPLELHNHAPSVQARNLTLVIEHITDGVSVVKPSLPMPQNVDEGEKYSQSLSFRLDNPSVSQVDICIKVEYAYDVFTNYTNERRSFSKCFNYTITFREVESIKNKYRQYAKKQTVKDRSMFFGRDILINKLYESISTKNEENNDVVNGGNGVVLYGQRRSGKTSILYHLEQRVVEKMPNTIVVNFGSVAKQMSGFEGQDETREEEMQQRNSMMTLQLLYSTIILGVKSYINLHNSDLYTQLKSRIDAYEKTYNEDFFPKTAEFSNSQNPQLIFNAFFDRFKTVAMVDDLVNGFRIVIIIDEFTYFNAAIENKILPYNFMEIMKGIVSDSFITLVVAGQDNMVEFMEKYVNEFSSFQREWVTFLEKDASYKMITDPIGENRIDSESTDKLYHFTAGSPFLLMNICCKLVDWINENKVLQLKSSLLDTFLTEKFMTDHEFMEDLFEPQYKDAGMIEWTEKNKLVLGLIARLNSKKVTPNAIPWSEFDEYVTIRDDILQDSGITSEEMSRILKRLVKRQVVEKQEGFLNHFRIKIPLYREWILRRGGAEYGNE